MFRWKQRESQQKYHLICILKFVLTKLQTDKQSVFNSWLYDTQIRTQAHTFKQFRMI